MSRLTLCISLIVAGLAVVGCGGSSDNKSSSDAPASQNQPVVAPSTGATAQASVAKQKAATAKKEAAKTASGLAAGSPQARKQLRKQLATIKADRRHTKSMLNKLNKPPKLSQHAQTLLKRVAKGKRLTKAEAKALTQETQKTLVKSAKGIKLQQPQEVGKKGRSLIPGRVAAACKQHLRAVDGALSSNAKASKLPGALNATIKELKVLGSTNSPAATGVTGDVPGISRTQETMAAMQRALAPAKAFKANPSAANRKKLQQALKGLTNTAKIDQLTSCAVA
jgi:hypothetical protein